MTASPGQWEHRDLGGIEVADRETATALAAFRRLVTFHQYDTVHRLHCYELAPRWLEASLRKTLRHTPEPTRHLLQLLYFQEPLPVRAAEELFGRDLVVALERAGILTTADDGRAVRSAYQLEVSGDALLLVERPATLTATSVYYGEDSQFFRALVRPRAGDACLDLCTGTGIQALRCAPLAARVDAVDVHPRAARLATLNVALNGLGDRITVHQGDLWEPLPDDAVWDHVVCNPPFTPVPDGVAFPLFSRGGADGLEVVRRVLRELPRRLTERGRCALIGACTGDADRPVILAEAEALAERGFLVTTFLLLRIPLRDWIKLIADTAPHFHPEQTVGGTILRSRAHYGEDFNRAFFYTFLLTCERGAAAGARVFDYSTVGATSYWFVNRGTGTP